MKAHRGIRLFGGLVLVALTAGALALVSGGLAGNKPSANYFTNVVEPQFLTDGEQGVAMGVFQAASGQGQGSATNVKITFDLPPLFVGGLAGTSSGCTLTDAALNVWTCVVGTVNAGDKRKRFLVFTDGDASASSTPYAIEGCASLDGGSSGAGGGGGANTECKTDTTTVVTPSSAVAQTRAGDCQTGGSATVETPLADSTTNLVSNSVQGTASSSLGLPCIWAFVGENTDTSENELSVPQISFMGFPLTETASPVLWITHLYSRPSGPFENLDILVDLNYTGDTPSTGNNFNGTEPPPCDPPVPPSTDPLDSTLPEGEVVCLIDLVKVGGGARARLLIMGTGGDPGNGWG